jgi:hypothetical protein
MILKTRFYSSITIFALLILAIFLSAGFISCSKGDKSTVAPPVHEPADYEEISLDTGRTTIGLATAYINPDTLEIEVVPHRSSEIHLNITAFLNSPNCPGSQCLTLKITGVDPALRWFYIDMEMVNPTIIDAYDLRIIVSGLPYDVETEEAWEIVNPDSFSPAYDPDPEWDEEEQWINPFIAFEKEDKQRIFLGDPDGPGPEIYSDKEQLILYVPEGSAGGAVILMVDVNWPDHCKDPYEISRWDQSDDLPVESDVSSVYVECIVADWQEDIVDVSIYCPDLFFDSNDNFIQMHEWPTTGVNAWPPGDGFPPFDPDEIDFIMEFSAYERDTLRKYWANINNEKEEFKGIYDGIIVAESVDTDWSGDTDDEIFDTIYQRVEIEVDEGGGSIDPTNHMQVVYSSYQNGNDSDIYTHLFLDGQKYRLTHDGNRESNEMEVSCNVAGTEIVFISNYNKDIGEIADFEIYKLQIQYAGDIPVEPMGDNTGDWDQLTSNNYDDRMPDFSPTGTMVAFSGMEFGQFEIYTVQNVSSFPPPIPMRVTYNFAYDDAAHYDRSNSMGTGLFFHSDRGGGGNVDIFYIDPTSQESINNLPQRLTWDPAFDGYPSSGPQLKPGMVWQSDRYQPGDMDILYTDYVETTIRLTENPAMDLFPSLSRNGEWIAFTSDRQNENMDIWRMYFNGANLTRMTNDEMPDFDPCFGGGL